MKYNILGSKILRNVSGIVSCIIKNYSSIFDLKLVFYLMQSELSHLFIFIFL